MVSLRPLTPFFDWQTSHLDRNGQRHVLNFVRVLVYVEIFYIFRLWKISNSGSSHNALCQNISFRQHEFFKVASFQFRYLSMSRPTVHLLKEEINVATAKVAKIFYCCGDNYSFFQNGSSLFEGVIRSFEIQKWKMFM